MGFKLRLKGYLDGNSIQETNDIYEKVVVSFEKHSYEVESEDIQESISTWVMPLALATVKSIQEFSEISDQPVISILHRKSALKQTTGFTYFPTYYIQEYKVDYSTVTFEDVIVIFEGDFMMAERCTKSPLITTKYTYASGGEVPVEVHYVEGLLNQIENTDNEFVQEAFFPWLSQRHNIHQINKNPIVNQGEIGATAQDKCIKFGVITRDKDVEFTITSGEPYDLRVTEMLVPAWLGIDLRDIGVNTILPAGGTLTFIIHAYAGLGRSDVRDFFTIKFDEVVPRFGSFQKVSICVDIHRRQSPDILIIPDKGSYHESIEYNTMEFKSVNNVVKTKPRMVNWKYSCKYTVTMHRTDYHKSFLNILKNGKHVVFQHPLWSQVTLLEQTMETSLFCKCDTSGCDFRVNEWAFVYVRPDEYYLRQISAIVSEGLMFSRAVVADVGAFVVPAFPAIVKGEIATSYEGERYIKGDVEVIEFREGEYYVPY